MIMKPCQHEIVRGLGDEGNTVLAVEVLVILSLVDVIAHSVKYTE